MQKTSFGEKAILWIEEQEPQVEYLKFDSEGRGHRHARFESFFVTKGRGCVVIDDQVCDVQAGDVLTIPPGAIHWMQPESGVGLEGIIWYHDTEMRVRAAE